MAHGRPFGVLRMDRGSHKRVRRIHLRGNGSWAVWTFVLSTLLAFVAAAWWSLHMPPRERPATEIRAVRP